MVGAGPLIMGISIVLWILSTFPNIDNAWILKIGQFIEPIFLPMGLDWRVGVTILLSFAVRQVFVSVLSLLIFFMIAIHCDVTLATAIKAVNSIRYSIRRPPTVSVHDILLFMSVCNPPTRICDTYSTQSSIVRHA